MKDESIKYIQYKIWQILQDLTKVGKDIGNISRENSSKNILEIEKKMANTRELVEELE